MPSNVPIGKKLTKLKMRSNMAIRKKSKKIKNLQQCGHWKEIDKNSKCAAMRPLENKFRKNQNAQHLKKNEKIQNAQQ